MKISFSKPPNIIGFLKIKKEMSKIPKTIKKNSHYYLNIKYFGLFFCPNSRIFFFNVFLSGLTWNHPALTLIIKMKASISYHLTHNIIKLILNCQITCLIPSLTKIFKINKYSLYSVV